MIGFFEWCDSIRDLDLNFVADGLKSISCSSYTRLESGNPCCWAHPYHRNSSIHLFIVPELGERGLTKTGWCQLAKAYSTWLYSTPSMVDMHQWVLTWNTKIFTLCVHSYRHIPWCYSRCPHQFSDFSLFSFWWTCQPISFSLFSLWALSKQFATAHESIYCWPPGL